MRFGFFINFNTNLLLLYINAVRYALFLILNLFINYYNYNNFL